MCVMSDPCAMCVMSKPCTMYVMPEPCTVYAMPDPCTMYVMPDRWPQDEHAHCPASGELSTDSRRSLGNFGETGAILRRTREVQGCSAELTIHEVNPGGFAIKNILKLNSHRLPGRRPAPGLALWLPSIISADSN